MDTDNISESTSIDDEEDDRSQTTVDTDENDNNDENDDDNNDESPDEDSEQINEDEAETQYVQLLQTIFGTSGQIRVTRVSNITNFYLNDMFPTETNNTDAREKVKTLMENAYDQISLNIPENEFETFYEDCIIPEMRDFNASQITIFNRAIHTKFNNIDTTNDNICIRTIVLLLRYVLEKDTNLIEFYDEIHEFIRKTLIRKLHTHHLLHTLLRPQQMTVFKQVLTEEMFNDIPLVKYEQSMAESVCYVCQDNFTEKSIIKQLPCNHLFHSNCIKPWLMKESNKCPCCRYEMKQYQNVDEKDLMNVEIKLCDEETQ